MNNKNWKIWLIIVGSTVLLAGLGYWFYTLYNSWQTFSLGVGISKNVVSIKYPSKYEDKISSNAELADQKMGLLSIPNVINFQLSQEARDKDINAFIDNLKKNNPPVKDEEGNETMSMDTEYKTEKIGGKTVYYLNEYNKSADFVQGDIFDGLGHRLNFTYRPKSSNPREINRIISKIKF